MACADHCEASDDDELFEVRSLVKLIAAVARKTFDRLRRREAEMHIVSTLSLGGGRQVVLILCENQKYIVGVGHKSVGCVVPTTFAGTYADIGSSPNQELP